MSDHIGPNSDIIPSAIHTVEVENMRKRSVSPYRGESAPKLLLSRDKAEKMCQKKLIQVQKEKSKLCQTVLVRNTLKYVQSSNKSTFAFVNTFQPEHYVPFSKKSCSDITSEDIDSILCDISFQDNQFINNDRKNSIKMQTWQHDDSLVPDNELCEDYIEELLRNRSNCTITKFTTERNMNCHTILHSAIF